jgi:putative phosphoribosyl transferase
VGSALVVAPEAETTGGWCWQSHQVPPGQSSWCRLRHCSQIIAPLCRFGRVLAALGGGYTPGMQVFPLPDRRTAGRLLAGKLIDLCSEQTVVLALPRGGVPVASEIAQVCGATLDVIVTRKIGLPRQPEFGIGAIAEGMPGPVYDDLMLSRLDLTPSALAPVAEAERTELERQVRVYRQGRPPPEVAGRPVIVVDDGLATGVTARAALRSLRAGTFGSGAPGSLVLAVPVAPPSAAEALGADADRVVTLATPRRFASVGEWYESFPQLTDADVLALLAPWR